MRYFADCKTVAEAKSLYRALAFQHHPDVGGVCAVMQAINAEYHETLSRMDGQHVRDEKGEQHEYHYSYHVEQAVMDMIGKVLNLHMVDVEVRLIGTWIWLERNTKPYREALGKEGLGFKWHPQRIAWYWKPYSYRTHYNAGASLDDLEGYYGGRKFANSNEAGMSRR